MNIEEPVEVEDVSKSQKLAERWWQTLSEASPQTLPDATKDKVYAIADKAMHLATSDRENHEAARRLGEQLFQTTNCPLDSVADIQAAWLAETDHLLPKVDRTVTLQKLSQLVGELAVGLCTARFTVEFTWDQPTLRRIRHDLKTPINSITGFSKVILNGIDGQINDLQREDLTTIFESSQRLLEMIDDVMGTLEQDAISQQPTSDVTNVSALMGAVAKAAQPPLAAEGHQLNMTFDGNLGELAAPFSQLRWLLLAILLTLGDFAENGQIKLAVERQRMEPTDQVVFHISSTGLPPEIDMEAVEKAPQFVAAPQLCSELGGAMSTSLISPGKLAIEMSLPAKAADTE